MHTRIKYLIFFVVFISTLILSISIYIEASVQKNIYTKSIDTIENVSVDNYKISLKNNVELSISYIDHLFTKLQNNEQKLLEEEILKLQNIKNIQAYKSEKFEVKEKYNLEKSYFVQKEILHNNKKYLIFLDNEVLKKKLSKELRDVFYKVDSKNKQYIWINEILDFQGGENYAKRIIHPNLKYSEGSFLSTNTKDIKGNLPYLIELNGIKKDKEIFFRYFFKEFESSNISEKLSYGKLYEKLNWVVATGVPLNSLETIMESRKSYLLNEYEKHFKKITIFGFISICSFIFVLYYLYRKIKKYTKENLSLEKKIIQNKLSQKYQKELEEKEEQYRYLMEATQDGVWDWNILTNEVYFSPRFKEMMGYKEHELENKIENWYENTHLDDREQIDHDVKENIEGKQEYYFNKHRVKCKDGSWIWIEDKGKVFFDENKKPFRMIGSHRDITKEKYYQDKLIKQEKKYRELFDNNGSMTLIVNPEDKSIIKANTAAQEFYGYSNEELKNLKVSDINIYDSSKLDEIINSILRDEQKEFYVKHKLKNGELVDVRILSTKTKYANKLALYTIVQDISEELKAKKDLKNTVQELEKIKDNLDFSQKLFHIGSWEYNFLSDELFLSKEIFNILEIPQQKLNLDEFMSFIHIEDKQKVQENIEKSIREKSQYNCEYRLSLENGKIKYISERAENYFDKDNKLIKTAGTLYDTTRDTLIESNWKSFFSLSLDLLLINDYEGNIIKINPSCEDILGYKVEELIGKNLFDIVHENDAQKTKHELHDLKNGKKVYSFENRYYRKNGTIVNIAWSSVFSKEQNVVYSMGQDITELKNKNYMLAQQSKMAAMGEMLGNIAHQWRQPLSLISTLSTGVKLKKELGVLEEKDFYESMDNIYNTTLFLSETIDDFRNFFKQNKSKSKFKISEILERTLKIVSAQFSTHEIQIIQNVDDYEIEALENEFLQVLVNIFNNSRDALIEKRQENRLIMIEVKKDEENIILCIKDNAFGISEDIISKIFEPYFTTKHQSQGTGIGLYMSEEIITKHMNGKIEVNNETFEYENKEYKGAKFTISLPIV